MSNLRAARVMWLSHGVAASFALALLAVAAASDAGRPV